MPRQYFTPLTLPADPANALDAATKQYVDTKMYMLPTVLKIPPSYTAAAGDYVQCDLTTGSMTITMPNAPANGTLVGARIVLFSAGSTVSLGAQGTDVFNRAGASNSVLGALQMGNMSTVYQYFNGIWHQVASGFLIGNMNTYWQPLATLTTKGDIYVATAAGVAARQGVGINGTTLYADSSQTNGIAWGPVPRVFASTAARDAAITAPTAGMTCFTTDTGSNWQYLGTAWYRPNARLTGGRVTGNVFAGSIPTAGVVVGTTGSLYVPANRLISVTAHLLVSCLNNGAFAYARMDAAAISTGRIATAGQGMSGQITLNGQALATPAQGNHTFDVVLAATSSTINLEGAVDPWWFEVWDLGAA